MNDNKTELQGDKIAKNEELIIPNIGNDNGISEIKINNLKQIIQHREEVESVRSEYLQIETIFFSLIVGIFIFLFANKKLNKSST